MSWEDEVDIFQCPYCHNANIISPIGLPVSQVLIIGEFDTLKLDYSEPKIAVLKSELFYHGIDIRQFRIVNLWYHKPNKRKDCYDWSIKNIVKEAKDKTIIMLYGSECVRIFTNINIGLVSGLQVNSFILSAPAIITCPYPNFTGGIGEFRFAVSNFIKKLEEYNLL